MQETGLLCLLMVGICKVHTWKKLLLFCLVQSTAFIDEMFLMVAHASLAGEEFLKIDNVNVLRTRLRTCTAMLQHLQDQVCQCLEYDNTHMNCLGRVMSMGSYFSR